MNRFSSGKRVACLLPVLLCVMLLLAACGGAAGGDVSSPREELYPVAVDEFDRGGDVNRDAAHATPIAVNRSYGANIFLLGDLDWFKVKLSAGQTNEVVVDHQCSTCVMLTRMYGSDGVTEGGERNNYYLSANRIKFTPSTSGSYFIKVEYQTLDSRQDWGVSNYWINVHRYVDGDGDDVSSWF